MFKRKIDKQTIKGETVVLNDKVSNEKSTLMDKLLNYGSTQKKILLSKNYLKIDRQYYAVADIKNAKLILKRNANHKIKALRLTTANDSFYFEHVNFDSWKNQDVLTLEIEETSSWSYWTTLTKNIIFLIILAYWIVSKLW